MHFFFNNWRIPFNNWSNLQITWTLVRLAGDAIKSGRGLLMSSTLRIRDFLIFNLMLPFFKKFFLCCFNVNYWQYFLFKAPSITASIYIHLGPNKDTVCFQRTKGFLCLWGRVLVKFNWILVFCLQLLFFWQSDF